MIAHHTLRPLAACQGLSSPAGLSLHPLRCVRQGHVACQASTRRSANGAGATHKRHDTKLLFDIVRRKYFEELYVASILHAVDDISGDLKLIGRLRTSILFISTEKKTDQIEY